MSRQGAARPERQQVLGGLREVARVVRHLVGPRPADRDHGERRAPSPELAHLAGDEGGGMERKGVHQDDEGALHAAPRQARRSIRVATCPADCGAITLRGRSRGASARAATRSSVVTASR